MIPLGVSTETVYDVPPRLPVGEAETCALAVDYTVPTVALEVGAHPLVSRVEIFPLGLLLTHDSPPQRAQDRPQSPPQAHRGGG